MSSSNLLGLDRTLHVGVILMGGTSELLDIAPLDLIHGMARDGMVNNFPDEIIPPNLKAQALEIEFHWVNETGKPAKLTGGMNVEVTATFETCPQLDVALMGAHSYEYQPNEAELAFIRKTFESCKYFLCICGGMMAPLQAGILHGRRATAPRMMLHQLKNNATGVDWTERRWEHDDKLWTSGALLNGLDMMKAFGEEVFGGAEKESLMGVLLDIGGWPIRNVVYKGREGLGLAATAENGV